MILSNPRRRRRHSRRRRAASGQFVAGGTPRHTRRRRMHRNPAGLAGLMGNPHRRHRRRRMLSNPLGLGRIGGKLMDGGLMAAGFLGGEKLINVLDNYVPQVSQGYFRPLTKVALSMLLDKMGGRFLGRRAAERVSDGLLLGGMVDVARMVLPASLLAGYHDVPSGYAFPTAQGYGVGGYLDQDGSSAPVPVPAFRPAWSAL